MAVMMRDNRGRVAARTNIAYCNFKICIASENFVHTVSEFL